MGMSSMRLGTKNRCAGEDPYQLSGLDWTGLDWTVSSIFYSLRSWPSNQELHTYFNSSAPTSKTLNKDTYFKTVDKTSHFILCDANTRMICSIPATNM
jgi:hypothetical protein